MQAVSQRPASALGSPASRAALRRAARALEPLVAESVSVLVPVAGLALALLGRTLGAAAPQAALVALVPTLQPSFEALHGLPASQRQALSAAIGQALPDLPRGGASLGWLYQYLRAARARAASGVSLTTGAKLGGDNLLLTTQFFTDPYMVQFLVERAAAHLSPDQRQAAAWVDPAVGGAGFLELGLRHGYHQSVAAGVEPRQAADAALARCWGYDLDPGLALVAKLALILSCADLTGWLPQAAPVVFAGRTGDDLGFLEPGVAGQVLGHRPAGGPMVVVTNPPFLGRRLMSSSLRGWLRTHQPAAGADLCVGFLQRCLLGLRPGDLGGFVHQTSWMYLSTFAPFRRWLFEHFELLECAELGSNAFADLSGEKTSVALSLLRCRQQPPAPSRFLRLVHHSRAQKPAALAVPPADAVHVVEPGKLSGMATGGLVYHLSATTRRLDARHPCYGDFADPMQGTSSGDNPRFVRFSWEVPADQVAWRSVSKGGGYCRWAGLNRHLLRWGVAGELVRDNPGSAMRNVDKMPATQLVYSDTGNQGLNVRLLEPGQLFMASGPGILVQHGDPVAHLAFLNSRLATYFVRSLSPKLTVSAGYIRRLPFPAAAAVDPLLVELAQGCVDHKRAALAVQLGNDEYLAPVPAPGSSLDDMITARLQSDLLHQAAVLELEGRIEQRLAELFEAGPSLLHAIDRELGPAAGSLEARRVELDLGAVDSRLASLLDPACRYRGGRRRGRTGCDSALEALVLELGCAPAALVALLTSAPLALPRTRERYRHDLLHQATLAELGFRSDRRWARARLGLGALVSRLGARFPGLDAPELRGWVQRHLAQVHSAAFLRRPILTVVGSGVTIARGAR
jgi:hypothetical protein